METFKNKVVWITGASSGIGEALARIFAQEGAILILSSRRKDELDRVKTTCNLNDSRSMVLPLDLSDTSGINKLTEEVISRFGRIDILINNAGVSQRSLTTATSIETDRKIMEINFFGTVAITKSVLPHFIKQQSGHFVVISSISGKFGYFLRSAYSASKHALHGFFESLRMEVYTDNIYVTLACLGKINTAITINAMDGNGEKYNKPDINPTEKMSASGCALQIAEAIRKKKVEVFIGGPELKAIWIKRFFPGIFFRLILKQKVE